MTAIDNLIRRTLAEFCLEFAAQPYLCYAEGGLHARFYARLEAALPPEERTVTWQGRQVDVVQKDYPTAGALGKARRQTWDIAVIAPPGTGVAGAPSVYDYFNLAAVVEFQINEPTDRLADDVRRMCHPEASATHRFLVQLYRLSGAEDRLSERDWSPQSLRILPPEAVAALCREAPVEVMYAMADATDTRPSGVWHIRGSEVRKIARGEDVLD